jgi:hypothetical protein
MGGKGVIALAGLAGFLIVSQLAFASHHSYPTTVSFANPTAGEISGTVTSPKSACVEKRTVKLAEVGAVEPLGSATTDRHGEWSVEAEPDSDVIATVARRALHRKKVCKPATAGPVDRTPPALAISSPATDATTGPTGTVIYTVGDSDTVSCTLDGGDASCDPPDGFFQYSLPSGPHTFVVTGTDQAGNAGEATRDWFVDATPPSVTALSIQGGSTTPSGTIDFTLSDNSEIAEIRCVLDGESSICGSGTSGSLAYSELSPGSHTVEVFGVDAFGNSGAAAAPGSPPAARARLAWIVGG